MKRLILILLLFPLILYSFDYKKSFEQANNYYNSGQYDRAKLLYHSLLDSGYTNSIVYYNLGNTYYRLNKIPDAIINYERAHLIDPLNEDINFNLKLANLRTVDKFDTLPRLFFIEWYYYFLNIANSDFWAISTIFFFFLTVILLFLTFWFSFSFIYKKRLFIIAIVCLGLMGLSLFWTFSTYFKEHSHKDAIIFEPTVYVKGSPDNNATDLFILHEGTKVEIIENWKDWYEVRIQNGNIGWIPKNSFQKI